MAAKLIRILPGVVLCAIIGLGALIIFPGAMAIPLAILAGVILGNVIRLPEIATSGIRFCENTVLSLAIVLMGVNLDFTVFASLGLSVIVLIVTSLLITLIAARLIGRWLGISTELSWLIGAGNGICGCAAIVATERIVGASKADVAASVTVINLLGTIGMVLLPVLLTWLFVLPAVESGVLIGNTLQAAGQVVASGYAMGESSGQTATIVKMGRILMLVPLMLFLMVLSGKRTGRARSTDPLSLLRAIPWFIIGFVALSLVATMGMLRQDVINILDQLGDHALIIAMAAIGLNIRFSQLISHGSSALRLGTMVFVVQLMASMLLILILF